MKALLREYLGALRERDELDAVLPDLLSELGFDVYARPQRGVMQFGVDVAAVSPSSWGERKVWLFSVKRGDLTRTDWSNEAADALRNSLVEIIDGYIPTRIPAEHAERKVVICIVLGGQVVDGVRTQLTQFQKAHRTDRIDIVEWDGDRLAGLLIDGILKEELLPKPLRSHLQKAVALLDEPRAAYHHFSKLAAALSAIAAADPKARPRVARQLGIATWMLFVWGREIGNVEGPYRMCELALLHGWEMLKPFIGKTTKAAEAVTQAFYALIDLNSRISKELFETRIAPLSHIRDGLASAVHTREAVDINLALFDLIGRLALSALWLRWRAQKEGIPDTRVAEDAIKAHCDLIFEIIENNPCLGLPVADEQATDIALVLLAWLHSGQEASQARAWIAVLCDRLNFAIRLRSRYPSASGDYRDWIRLPTHARDDEVFKEATKASTLVPLLALWVAGFEMEEEIKALADLRTEHLSDTTMQLWLIGPDSECSLYLNGSDHGRTILDLPIKNDPRLLLETVAEAAERYPDMLKLSAIRTEFWPIMLLACRHWRLPIPPTVYIDNLMPPTPSPESS